jgi:hypothetical protein
VDSKVWEKLRKWGAGIKKNNNNNNMKKKKKKKTNK